MRPATGWRWQIEKICLNSFLIWVWTWVHSLRINWSRSSIGQWSAYLTHLYARTGGTWVGPVTLYYFGNGIPSIVAVSTSRHAPSDPMADLGSLTLLMAVENRAPEALPWQGLRELSTAKAPQGRSLNSHSTRRVTVVTSPRRRHVQQGLPRPLPRKCCRSPVLYCHQQSQGT